MKSVSCFTISLRYILAVFLLFLWVDCVSAQLSSRDIEKLREQGKIAGWTFEIEKNEAADLSLDDLCGAFPATPEEEKEKASQVNALWTEEEEVRAQSLPLSFDWRNYDGCTHIRNQGNCGSCWAFAAVGAIECNIKIRDGVEQDLSEQWLVSCTGAGSCSGGWHTRALNHYVAGGSVDNCTDAGAVMESDCSYTSSNSECDCPYPHYYMLNQWGYSGDSVNQIKSAIYNYGPVAVTVAVSGSFQGYGGGIYNANDSSSINHAVVLVGWDDNQGANGVWVLRNSWGTGWGEGGYMRIEYGCNRVGTTSCFVDYGGIQDLAGHWSFNDGSGTTAADSSANDRDGTLMNMDEGNWCDGYDGGALSFDGVDDYVEIDGYQGVDGMRSRTIAAWIKTETTGTIVSWGDDLEGGKCMLMVSEGYGSPGSLLFGVWGGYLVGSTDLRDGKWHHVAVVLEKDGSPDVSQAKLYVDGTQESVSRVKSCAINTIKATNVNIGRIDATYGYYFNGQIDELYIYSYALDNDELVTLYSGRSGFYGAAGHWSLDEGTGDVARDSFLTERNGTLINMVEASWVSGVRGGALQFDGVNDFIGIDGYDGVTGKASRTVSAWIKTSSVGTILSWGAAYPGEKWMFMVKEVNQTAGALQLGVWGGYVVGSTNLWDGHWHHVAAVLPKSFLPNVSEVKLYVDGKEESLSEVKSHPIVTDLGVNVNIGRIDADYKHYFKGFIDDVRIYDFAMRPEQINKLCSPCPMGAWNLNENSGPVAYDSSGNGHDGTLFHMAQSSRRAGVEDNGLLLDGVDDYIAIEGYRGVGGGFSRSLSAWIKTDSVGTIVSWGNGAPGRKWMLMVQDAFGVPGALRLGVWGGHVVGSTDLRDGKWHHVAAVYDNMGVPDVSEVKLYVDGVVETISDLRPQLINTDINMEINIGRIDADYGYYFNGMVDEIHVYDYALSEKEIGWLCCRGLAGYWAFDEDSGGVALDSSVQVRNGTLNNMDDNDRTAGYENNGLSFDGVDDYVEIDGYKGISGSDPRTCTAWIKSTSEDLSAILSWGRAATREAWMLTLRETGVANLSIWGGAIDGEKILNDGHWHHVAAVLEEGTVDVSQVKLYVDGELEKTSIFVADLSVNTALENNLQIGCLVDQYGNNSFFFEGTIDEVRVYNYAMNQDEIKDVYSREQVGFWTFDEGAGLNTADVSGNGRDGSLINMVPDDWVRGIEGTALLFDGIDDYVEISDYQGVPEMKPRTVGAWIKTESTGTIFSWGSAYPGRKWMFMVQDVNGIPGSLQLGVWGGFIVGSTDLRDGKWHHVAAVLENDGSPDVREVALYVDGVLETISAVRPHLINTDINMGINIGRIDSDYGYYFNGNLDDVFICNYALSPEKIADIAKIPADLNKDDTVDLLDLAWFLSNWMIDNCDPRPAGDLDIDCDIDLDDYDRFTEFWLRTVGN